MIWNHERLGMYYPAAKFGDYTSNGFCVIVLTHTHTLTPQLQSC